VVLNQFQAQRARLLADLEKATVEGDVARIAAARRAVAEARLRVARLLKLTGANLAPAENSGFYWEKYNTGGGIRFRAFARYTVPKPNFEKLVERYTAEHEALGIKVVPLFPGLGWRYPELDEIKGGVLIMGISNTSPFAMVGFGDGDVVLEVNDRAVKDGDKFVEAFSQEYQTGCARGGKLELRIKHGDHPVEDYRLNLPRGCGAALGSAEKRSAPHRAAATTTHPSGRKRRATNIWDEILNDNPEE
jgi:hypothetical protein